MSVTDSEGHTKMYSYSAPYEHAYLTSITEALGNVLFVSYEFETGKIMAITTPNGNITSYEYDLLGRTTRKVNSDLLLG
jgi:YD repeat-containing protein